MSKTQDKLIWTGKGNFLQCDRPDYQFYTRKKRDGGLVLDIFDATIKDDDDAYLLVEEFDSLIEAKDFAQEWLNNKLSKTQSQANSNSVALKTN